MTPYTPPHPAEAAGDALDLIVNWLDNTSFDVEDHLTWFTGRPHDEVIDSLRYHADRLHQLAREDRL